LHCEHCREELVPASHSAERKCSNNVGDRAPFIALRAGGRLAAELHRRRSGRVPAVPQAAAVRRPRPSGRPRSALPVGVRSDGRRTGGAAGRRASPDGPDVRIGVVWDVVDDGHGSTRGSRVPAADGHRRRTASRPLAQVIANVCPGTRNIPNLTFFVSRIKADSYRLLADFLAVTSSGWQPLKSRWKVKFVTAVCKKTKIFQTGLEIPAKLKGELNPEKKCWLK